MTLQRRITVAAGIIALFAGGLVVLAQNKPKPKEQDQERKVKESEVPAAALATLKKMANGAKITEFAEEKEHGHTFYEGSWAGPDGKMDVLVTPTGDLVEIEETVAASKVPAAVLAAAQKEAGKDAALKFEKKSVVMYEAKFKKGDKRRELVLLPTGDKYHEEQEEGDKDEDD